MTALASEPLNPDGLHMDDGSAVQSSKRPDDTAFKQQKLKSWQPVMSPPYVISCFLITGIIFIIIGAVVVVTSDGIQEVVIRYDQVGDCNYDASDGYACPEFPLPIQLTKKMKAPVYMYYKLENLYQNHRRYAKSRSDDQLAGNSVTESGLSDCSPLRKPGEYTNLGNMGSAPYEVGGDNIDPSSAVYSPCGLIAWSMFNDSFVLEREETSGTTLICDGANFNATGDQIDTSVNMQCKKRGIAWPSDPGVRYVAPSLGPGTITNHGWPGACTAAAANTSDYSSFLCNGEYLGEVGHKIPDTQDEDLMVWMRLASLSSFRKLYRVVTSDLEVGSYILKVRQRYDMRAFDGKKSFVLSTTSWIGGKNYFLGGLYIGVGSLCVILGVGFLVKYLTTQRRVANI